MCWKGFGAVLILTAALSNTSCCSSRKAVEQTRVETAATVHAESQTAERQETTQSAQTIRTEQTTGVTVTEIEIYDTTQPADPTTGTPPVKARVRQRHDQNGTSHQVEKTEAATATETTRDLSLDGGTLEEVTVTATREPSLWERIKKGVAWASALIVLAAVGWIIYKLKK